MLITSGLQAGVVAWTREDSADGVLVVSANLPNANLTVKRTFTLHDNDVRV